MSSPNSPWKKAAGLAGVALQSFAGTLLLFLVAGLVFGAGSYYYLRNDTLYAVIAASLVLAEALAAGVFLGGKRALVMTAAHGFKTLGLGRSAVKMIFTRLLGVNELQPFGERGGQIAQTVERIPLAEAQQRLTHAVNDLVHEPVDGGSWFHRKLHGLVLRGVERITLAKFREAGAKEGGVDLLKVQADLHSRVEEMLIGKLRAGLNMWTGIAVLVLPVLAALQAYAIETFIKRD